MATENIIIFDTNFIFQYKKVIKEIVKKLQVSNAVYVTQITIDECIANDTLQVVDDYATLKKIAQRNIKIAKIDFLSEKNALREIEDSNVGFFNTLFGADHIIPFPTYERFWNEVLKRANLKTAPFIKGDSDKGLKDTLMWLSIVEYFKHNSGENIIFISDDNGFIKQEDKLCQEFATKTSKRVTFKRNEYYKELLGEEAYKVNVPAFEKLSNANSLRERISEICKGVMENEEVNYYGDEYTTHTFLLSKKVDTDYMKRVFDNLDPFINNHLFEKEILANDFLDLDFRVASGQSKVKMVALEALANLHDEIKKSHPQYIDQFYSAVANIFNANCREGIESDTELPF